MSEELFLRDDIIEFNNKLDADCFNVKAYRKSKNKSKKTSLLAATTTDLAHSQQPFLRINKSMDKTQFSLQKLTQKRLSMTAAVNRRHDISQNLRIYNRSVNMRAQIASHKKQQEKEVKTAKINYTTQQGSDVKGQNMNSQRTARQSSSNQVAAKSKYHQLEKKYHKNGPINDRAIQNWLNQILMDYCNQENFDKSIQNAALKKMSLDRNSLLSQGIKPQYVNRVYKSMFVYSIGFNNLLKQLSGKNTHLKKTIWKVYAILLQFCSEGTFQTMIGEIERDKAHKIQSLRQQIEKRQRVIQNNDEINEEKNAKIFKQLKILREENVNLENQKNVLMEDFKQAEQSFNQEVSLRLKFQNKINEIHGIHHELATKHARLYDDYHKKVKQIQNLQQKFKETSQNYLVFKQKLSRTLEQLGQQKRDNLALNQTILKYEQMRTRFQNSQIQLKNSKQDLLNIIKQKSRKISQLQIELQNSQIMLNLSKSSSKQLEGQYREQLQENRRLHSTIRDQIDQLNDLFTQKKNFNQKHMSYVAQIQFLKNKDSEHKILLVKLKKQIKEQTQTNQTLLLQKMALDKKVENIEKDLAGCYDSIQNMKRTKNIYQEELIYLKKKSEIHGEVVRQKDTLITSLTKANQKLNKQNQELITLNKNLDSKTAVLTQRLRSEEDINKKKYEKLKQQRDQLFKQNSQHDAILKEKINELQKYMGLYDKEMLNMKNQKFERVNLDLRYKQSLQVMESQNEHIKNLNIIISENHEEIEEWKRKYRNFEYILKEKQRLLGVEISQLKLFLEEIKKQLNRRKMFINPMISQDLKGLLKRSIQKYELLLKQHNSKVLQFKNSQASLKSQLQTQKAQHIEHSKEQELKSLKKLQEKQYEIEYEKQKCKHLQYKVEQFQKLLNQNKAGNEGPNSFKQKQRKYLNTIKQKSQNVEKLLKQLESAHDHNNTLIRRISEIEFTIGAKDNEISDFQKKITKLTQDLQSMEKQKVVYINRPISSRADDYDESLLAVMNNQNVLTSSFQRQNSTRKRPTSRQPSGKSNKKLPSKQQTQFREDQQLQVDQNNKKGKQKTQKVVNPVWRNDLSKKLKHAFNYYQK